MDILEGLNDEQLQAVTHESGPLLIIAGAGTGKTTVVTRRIANLIESGVAKPEEILALTFTDKAAGEMEERVDSLLTMSYVDLWISTFHSFGERMLQEHALDVGLSTDFRLLSDMEQWVLLKENLDDFELDYYKPKSNPTKFVQALISHFSRLKDEDITPEQYMEYAQKLEKNLENAVPATKEHLSDEEQAQVDEAKRVMEVAKAYIKYQELLRANNALDFGDLIVETIHMLQQRPAVLQQYREQFKYILVDEFQDTNIAQYDLVKLLAAPNNNLTVVADDDQSIYSFRGASMSNIINFQKDYPNAEQVALVQNYRSTQNILDLSHEFIQHNNPDRLEEREGIDKRLKASGQEGEGVIEHLHSASLEGEAKLVLDKILELKEAGGDEIGWGDFAILVRANSQADTFLPYLERSGVPYQFLASQGLFAKPVILDILAFMRLLDNYHESRAMYRVLTYGHWGIGHDDIIEILHYGKQKTQSIYETCKEIREVEGLAETTYTAIEKIVNLTQSLTELARTRSVGEVILRFLDQSGYLKNITDKENEEAAEQILYINQLYKYVEAFERANPEKNVRNFVYELNSIQDAGDQGRLQPDFDEGPDAVKIMTVHASKGLEFEYVFVVNMVDKRFPTTRKSQGIAIPEALVKDVLPEGDFHVQEERRLFYVAMTRAKRGLFLTSGEDYGGARKKKPSRFLVESGFIDTPAQPTGEVILDTAEPVETASQPYDVQKHLPKTLSFTQLKAYETCPWQYRFAFLLKVPVPGKPSFSFGKTIHNSLYEFFRRMKECEELQQGTLFDEASGAADKPTPAKPNLDDLMQIYDEQWIGDWYNTKKQRDEYYEKGKEALQRFYEMHEDAWPQIEMLEKPFKLQVGEYTLKGAIDRVDVIPEKSEGDVAALKVIDYKTGSFPKTGKKDMEQLYIYAMALQEVFQQEAVQLSYYYVEDNKAIDSDVDPEKLEKVRAWILEMAEKIMTGEFPAQPGFHCKFCDFKDICEYRA